MEISTREIAHKLFRYEMLLEGMKAQYSTLYAISHEDSARDVYCRLESEIAEVRAMANALYEKKTTV